MWLVVYFIICLVVVNGGYLPKWLQALSVVRTLLLSILFIMASMGLTWLTGLETFVIATAMLMGVINMRKFLDFVQGNMV